MALTETETKIGELGAQLAQAHYALTTDHEGALPMRATDADRQKLVALLGRASTLEEEALFDAGYREGHLRLAQKGGPQTDAALVAFHPVMHAELLGLLAKYGVSVPPEGTPERDEAKLLITRAINQLKDDVGKLLHTLPDAQ